MRQFKIPKVDEGIKGTDYENLQSFYSRCRVNEYVHVAKGGGVLKFEFENMLDNFLEDGQTVDENPYARAVSYAEISKKSFRNNVNVLVRYINYFIEYFDDDMELMTAYFYAMHAIMMSKYEFTPDDLAEHLRSSFATNTMIEKVIRLVDYNTDEAMMKKVDKKYDESIQLTTEHMKSIMGISCIHKFIIPIVSQYIKARHSEVVKSGFSEQDLYFYVFTKFIDVFDEYYDIDLFNKFYHTATTRVSKTKNEQVLWSHRDKDGVSPTSLVSRLMRDLFIDISQKVIFNKSAIVFIHVCFDKAIRTELIKKDKYEYSDMEMIASDNVNESMSKWDSWQQNNHGYSEKDKYRAEAIISDFLNRTCRELGIERHKKRFIKEYNYYRDNMPKLDDTQLNVIFLYFANRLGSYEVTSYITRADMNWFIMIMKRELFSSNYIYLPYFITGKLDTVNAKTYSKKKIGKLIEQHPSYEDYLDQYSAAYELLNTEKIFATVRALIANKLYIVDYDHQDCQGKALKDINENTAVDEFIRMYIDL